MTCQSSINVAKRQAFMHVWCETGASTSPFLLASLILRTVLIISPWLRKIEEAKCGSLIVTNNISLQIRGANKKIDN